MTPKRPLTASEKLQNITDALCESIMEMSEEELRAEMVEDGLDPDAEIERVRAVIKSAIAKSKVQP